MILHFLAGMHTKADLWLSLQAVPFISKMHPEICNVRILKKVMITFMMWGKVRRKGVKAK